MVKPIMKDVLFLGKSQNMLQRQICKLGYLYRVSDPRIEDLVDEMLAILSDRDAIIQKKEMEHAQVVINEIYRNGL